MATGRMTSEKGAAHRGVASKAPRGWRCGGFALPIVVMGMVVIGACLAGLFGVLGYTAQALGARQDHALALIIAEAGLNDAIARLRAGELEQGNIPETPFANGSYSVEVGSPNAEGEIPITSVGRLRRVQRTVSVRVTSGDSPWKHVVYRSGDLTNHGQVRYNPVGGEHGPATGALPVPDLNAYREIADTVLTGDFTFPQKGSFAQLTGITFITGDVTLKTHCVVSGTLVVVGDLDIKGQVDVTRYDNYPAILVTGHVKGGDQNVNIDGPVYCGGDWSAFPFNIYGCLLGRNVTIGGNYDLNYNYDIESNPPPYFSWGQGSGNYAVVRGSWEVDGS